MPAQNIAISHADTGLVTAEVGRAERISPSFVRLTLVGPELRQWRHIGFDQWFRLAIPVAGDTTRFDRLSERFDMRGYLRYLTLPKATRPAIRSYTVREFRAEAGEIDVDCVVHGAPHDPSAGSAHDAGIAGPWAASLPQGARVALIDQGCGYRPTRGAAPHIVLAGDESALPAVAGILRDLPRDATGDALIEVPDPADRQPLHAPDGVAVHWLTRSPHDRPGTAALERLRNLPAWDPTPSNREFRAFVAGEQQLATGGRRALVAERGVAKADVTFCGYWRQK
ncbi:siderophore-interacting protein [Leucobacter luti]|uniref:siderophore-interacting protein n=1 Tax=Leucobacter luti TaxID=340320 RepID=UPI0010493E38|nr:siderophore-interacting protein [Leucobacter luti]MCW2289513.1 NADPH-dependent ferric siderophore reductase [Leucobacter luti]QYM74735.1 siderophore-interacting protein [Leucobacter luti]TCK33876.1 NADPH-dependent ferric siderophore reductase [Leucobacter luti]